MPGSKALLSGRYAFQSLLKSHESAFRWLAIEAGSGRRVVLALVEPARISSVTVALGVQHRHLAGLIDVISGFDPGELPPGVQAGPGSAIAVAEQVPGKTLAQQLALQPLTPGKAVAWILRLVDAVQALHAKGAIHGAISPWSVIAEPEGRAIAPALAQLLAPPVGAYCPPERLKGAAEAVGDDIWALHATLYAALTGKAPFLASERDALRKQMMAGRPKPLSEYGLDEPALAEIVSRGLVGERRLRVAELGELSHALDGWERDPRALPPRRAPAPRPTARGVADLLANPNPGSLKDGIVIDASVLTVSAAAAPPPLPAVSAPVMTGPPPLPAVSAPPPLPAAARPLPATTPSLPGLAPPLLATTPSLPGVAPPLPAPLPALPPLPPEPAWTPASQISLDQLVAQLPKPAPGPFPAVVAPVPAPAKRRLSFNPFEKKRKLWPIVLAAAATGGLGVYVAGSVGSAAAPPPAASVSAPTTVPKPRVAEKPKASPAEARESCVRSHFPERAFQAGTDLGFLCEEGDFRELSKRLFTVVKQQPASESEAKPGAAPEPGLGWYELPAAAIIRKSCCVAATAVVLPETVGWCEQLQSAVRRIADDSDKAGDVAPGARSFDKAVTCLYVHRINRPYTFSAPPSEPQRRAFQRFLSLAAVSDARR